MQISRTSGYGCLSRVSADCSSAHEVERVRTTILTITTRPPAIDGMMIRVDCNRREADRLAQSLQAMADVAAPVAPAVTAARTWKHRALVSSYATTVAQSVRMPDGTVAHFSGFGREFIAGEIEGPLWGDSVRYAYYA